MSLSDYERRVLKEIEYGLAADVHRSRRRVLALCGVAAGVLAAAAVGVVVGTLTALPATVRTAFTLVAGLAVGAGTSELWRRWRLLRLSGVRLGARTRSWLCRWRVRARLRRRRRR